jgi:hypothetical protein
MRTAALLAALLSATPAARAAVDAQTTEATGQAAVAGDLLAAREHARDDALRNCVQQVASAIVTAATEADQARLLSDEIYSRPVGYVRRFRILDDRQDGNAWVTRLRCDVSEARLDEDLLAHGIAYQRPGMPRVLVLVSEQAVDDARAGGWWQGGGKTAGPRVVEDAFVDRMQKSGFTFVDAEELRGKVELESIPADPDVREAREVGVKAGAELVIVGRAVARPLGQVPVDSGAFHSTVADVSARAVRTDTGQVVAAADFTAPAGRGFEQSTAGRDALSEAGRMLAREMFTRVGKVWAGEQSGLRRIGMTVRGVDDYGRLAVFKNALVGSIRGVKDVQERSLGEGRAELEVALSCTTQAFATELATRKFQGLAVEVRKVTAGAVEVELR